jgi:hypothetical protein
VDADRVPFGSGSLLQEVEVKGPLPQHVLPLSFAGVDMDEGGVYVRVAAVGADGELGDFSDAIHLLDGKNGNPPSTHVSTHHLSGPRKTSSLATEIDL